MSNNYCRIITLTSGKGGVGKSTITLNTGIALAKNGYKVCVFDADVNLANLNIMLGQTPEYTLQHVISGEKSVTDIMQQKEGLYVVPGASGLSEFVNFNQQKKNSVLQALKICREVFDFILIDAAAGISDSVFSFMQIAQQNILIITTEPTSLTDAFSLIKVFVKKKPKCNFSVIVNQVVHQQQAKNVYRRFSKAVEKYIGINVDFISGVLKGDVFSKSICEQIPVIVKYPNILASSNFRDIAEILCKREMNLTAIETIENFVVLNENKQPDFSIKKRSAIVPEKTESLQQSILNKLSTKTLNESQYKAILDIIEQQDIAVTSPSVDNKNDEQDGMLSSIKYAALVSSY